MSKKDLTGIEKFQLESLKNLVVGFEGSAASLTISQDYYNFLTERSSKSTELAKCEETKAGGYLVPAPLLSEAVASVGSEPKSKSTSSSKSKGDK